MKLQGRNLELNLRGQDVKLLQEELKQLGFQAVQPSGFFDSVTYAAVQNLQRQHDLPTTGIVDQRTASYINRAVDAQPRETYLVKGRVLRPDGEPVLRTQMRALEKHLRRETPLGEDAADTLGQYEISYPIPESGSLSLVVRAFDIQGNELAASSVICDARPIETVDLTVGKEAFRGPSEFKQLQDRVTPLLTTENIALSELTAADVNLLACQHDLNGEHVAYLVRSAQLARETDMPAEWFYALVRQGLPTILIALVAQSLDILRRALESSVRENIVGAGIQGAIPEILRRLQDQIVRLALRPSEPDRPTLGMLLDVAEVRAERKQRIVADYLQHTGSIEEFWLRLRREPDIGDKTVDELQYVLRLATVTLNHEPLVRELMLMRSRSELGPELRDLARFNRSDWEALLKRQVQGRPIGAPAVLGGAEDERPTRFAVFLERMAEAILPTAVLAHRLAELDEPAFAPTIAFLRRNPDFDFTTMRVHEYLRERPNAIEGDVASTTKQLRAVQRMMNIAPAFNKTAAVRLIADGIDSAITVRRMGAPQFLRTRAQRFDSVAEAEQFYTNAARQADTALMLLSQSVVFNPTQITITAPHLFGEGVPDLEDLFGSLDLCQCEWCGSVYSPAAYLVDILHFLMNRPAKTGNRTALDVLFGDPSDPTQRRRGDIGHIELTCHNTNTMLPYVDLVNEILERAIAPGGESSFQTQGEAEVLAANPEHLNVAAYNTLAQAVYAWALPFDLWAAEARSYLQQLGVLRYRLMEAFLRPDTSEFSIDIATEYLGLTPRERAIITGSATEAPREFWGMETAEFNRLLAERRAAVVLERSGLSYEELNAVLDVRLVDPAGTLRIQFEGADCNLDTATITGLTAARLGRLHRFVRLQRKLGWPTWELGTLLQVLGANDLDDDALLQLAQIKRIRELLQPSWDSLFTWWSNQIDRQVRDGQPSLYERVFSDPTINPPTVDVFALNNAGTELSQSNVPIGEHASAVSSAIGINLEDLNRLVTDELPDDRLNLANLTRLYSIATFTRALKITIREYLAMRGLTGADPLGPGQVAQTDRFVRLVQDVREVGVDLVVLDYLFRHRTESSPAIWSEAQVGDFLAKLRLALRQIAADRAFASDPAGERTAETLALVLPGDLVDRTMALLNGNTTEDQAAQTALIDDHLSVFLDPADAVERLVSPGTLVTPEERFDYVLDILLAHLIRRASEALVVENLATALALPSEVADALLRRLVPSPTDPAISSLAVFLAPDFLADTENDDETIATFPDQSRAFHRLAKIATVLNALSVPPEHVEFMLARGPALGWVDLIALPLEAQESAAPLFERWLRQGALFRVAAGLSGGVAGLFELLSLLDEPDLTRTEFLDRLAEITGWNRADIEFLAGPDGFDFDFPSAFTDGQFLVRLKPCFALLSPLGVSAQEARRWATPSVNAEIARAIKQAVRAKFPDQQQWLAVAQPIRDALREQQRAALVAYLVHAIRVIIPRLEPIHPLLVFNPNPPLINRPAVEELKLKLNASGVLSHRLTVNGVFDSHTFAAVIAFQAANNVPANGVTTPPTWDALDQVRQRLRGPEDLYAHFLIDVEMDPCMLTSRLVLATNSVQLFVQRCLLNLEPEVEFTPEDAKEWAWMNYYRVWEANRKVFLYPENWIEPELRDDKTAFFKQLESGLLQDEVNDATVEREYLKYLEELDRVAQLEISGLYRQWEVDQDILHVIGRTRNTPHIYYYRQWIDQRHWTSWEKVDVDIEGDHLVPVVWNRRLYLFWPMFMERAIEEVAEGEPPQKYYEIRLAWSEYREGKWSPKQVSESLISNQHDAQLPMKEAFAFWSEFDDAGNLLIGVEVSSNPFLFALPQFQFGSCDSDAKLVYRNHVAVAEPPNTNRLFNAFHEKPKNNVFELAVTAVTDAPHGEPIHGTELQSGGGFDEIEIRDQVIEESEVILKRTPGEFRLIPSHSERPLASRHPFFYQDDTRSFFVVPSGGYSGGFGVGDLKFNLRPTHNAVPLELPDSIVARVATLASRNAGSSTSRPSGNASITNDRLPPGTALVTAAAAERSATVTNRVTTILGAPVAVHVALPKQWEAKFFQFHNFYHPYVCLLIEQLNRHGIEGILKPDPEKEPTQERRNLVKELRRQRLSEAFFNADYAPNPDNVVNIYGKSHLSPLSQQEKDAAGPLDEFDFSYGGAYSVYNWELFFHAPFMISKRLSANRRFAEAQRWFHYIFDPTYAPGIWPERVWHIKPFFEHGVGKSIEKAMLLLKSAGLSKQELAERGQLRDQIDEWRKHPFNPHLIARLRPEAYMKAVVMAYLDNLIAWSDHLFRQDTRESINEATQLYVLASEILGERPREIPAHEGTRKTIDGHVVNTFEQLRGHLDAFSNALVDLETVIYPMDSDTGGGGSVGSLLGATDFSLNTGNDDNPAADLPFTAPGIEPPDDGTLVLDLPLAAPVPAIVGPTLFFCIPKNDNLLGYWDTVADRLFKIRHCMNIEGVERQLALFAPPIDPGLLVKAAAAGLDIGSVLSDLNAPSPVYRFQVLVQKASELANDVKSLGTALLSVLEKRDAEELAILRSTQEIQVLNAVRDIKLRQIDEAKRSKEALEASKSVLGSRQQYYTSRLKISAKEQEHQDKLEDALGLQIGSQAVEIVRAVFAIFPDFDLGIEGAASSPTVKARWGGSNIAAAHQAISQGLALGANIATYEANKALTEAGYDRRKEEWDFQAAQATEEITQIEKQIAAVELRIGIAEQDLKNHDLQIENAKAIDEYMHNKYTNAELYNWMIAQVSAVYFQSYQLAYDLAKRAERALRNELGLQESSYVQFGYWDGLKKGLFAGEKLHYDLRRMEVAYLDQNKRELEIVKQISLLQLDPMALIQLRQTGTCEVAIPEALFDLEYPGHYLRRIKNVRITIPCVTGPYTSVPCTVSLLRSSVRHLNTLLNDGYARDLENEDPRFTDSFGVIQSVVTSSGQNDSGLFETNLRDDRYLPFEGAGVISTWRLELPNEFRQFNYDSISDIVLQFLYTARQSGGLLKQRAISELLDTINTLLDLGLARSFSIRHEFNSAWHRFLNPATTGADQTLTLALGKERFPFLFQGRTITINRITLLAKVRSDFQDTHNAGTLKLTLNEGDTAPTSMNHQPADLLSLSTWNGLLRADKEFNTQPGNWTINAWLDDDGTATSLAPNALEELLLVVHYTVA